MAEKKKTLSTPSHFPTNAPRLMKEIYSMDRASRTSYKEYARASKQYHVRRQDQIAKMVKKEGERAVSKRKWAVRRKKARSLFGLK